jgi:FixJ family two-component response regulator
MQRTRVAVIDDDESVREALPDLLREFGYQSDAYSSAEEFLRSLKINEYVCLVLDIAMPGGMSGIELQSELERRGHNIPIVFITAHGDESLRQSLRKEGVECLRKPFTDTGLQTALQAVLVRR